MPMFYTGYTCLHLDNTFGVMCAQQVIVASNLFSAVNKHTL